MALYERLVNPDPNNPRIPVHSFMAAISELGRGAFTKSQVEAMLGIRAEDQAQFDSIVDKGAALVVGERFEFARVMHDMLLLATSGMAYTTFADFNTRLNAEPKRPS